VALKMLALVAITVGFGAPRPTAVLAVLGYRLVNYWLPLLPGRWLPSPAAEPERTGPAKPSMPGGGSG
jgi:hypothetical protein